MTDTVFNKSVIPQWSKQDFLKAVHRVGIPPDDVLDVQEKWKRHIAELKGGRSIHAAHPYAPPRSRYRFPPTDLLAEAKVLDVLFPHMQKIGVEVPRVLDTLTSSPVPGAPEGLLQIRTWVQGETLENAMKRREFDPLLFLQNFGKMVAHLHACPLEEFGAALPDQDPRGILAFPMDLTLPARDRCTHSEKEASDLCIHFNDLASQAGGFFIHNDLSVNNFLVGPRTSDPCALLDFELSYRAQHPVVEFAGGGVTDSRKGWAPLLKGYNAVSARNHQPSVTLFDVFAAQAVVSFTKYGFVKPSVLQLRRPVRPKHVRSPAFC